MLGRTVVRRLVGKLALVVPLVVLVALVVRGVLLGLLRQLVPCRHLVHLVLVHRVLLEVQGGQVVVVEVVEEVVVGEVHKVVCMVVVREVALACTGQGLHSSLKSNLEHTYHDTYLRTSVVPLVMVDIVALVEVELGHPEYFL